MGFGAFLAELDHDRPAARFWVAVYDLIAIAAGAGPRTECKPII
ncbi:MAG TPA: hypothetical protein VN930_09755 [Xanthobacteraceae bacterium]|nr:hypothetical protein [Xanthobacteraceae bacterium]